MESTVVSPSNLRANVLQYQIADTTNGISHDFATDRGMTATEKKPEILHNSVASLQSLHFNSSLNFQKFQVPI